MYIGQDLLCRDSPPDCCAEMDGCSPVVHHRDYEPAQHSSGVIRRFQAQRPSTSLEYCNSLRVLALGVFTSFFAVCGR